MKIYTCPICNKTFTNPQAFNGHKSGHNPLNTVRLQQNHTKRQKERYDKSVEEYLLNPTKCMECGKDLPYEKRIGYKFCGSSCSAKHSNKHGNRSSTKGKTKQAKCTVCGIDMFISLVASDKNAKCHLCKGKILDTYLKNNPKVVKPITIITPESKFANCEVCGITCKITKYRQRKYALCINCRAKQKKLKLYKQLCKICGKEFEHTRITKACSKECLFTLRSECGKRSASTQADTRRSKNEIHFAELCKTVYKEVLTNVPMFNSWDADVILPNEKIAVLWNGMWHHKKCAKKHSLEQTQSRDKIKRHEIENAGYICYVIDDFGKANPEYVIKCFNIFKEKHPPIL